MLFAVSRLDGSILLLGLWKVFPGMLFLLPGVLFAGTGWLGVYTDTLVDSAAIAELTGRAVLPDSATAALRVSLVFPDSPAERCGLLEGDLIYRIDGQSFAGPANRLRQEFRSRLSGRDVGATLVFEVYRNTLERSGDPEFWRNPKQWAAELAMNDSSLFTIHRHRSWLKLEICLGQRPEAQWSSPEPNSMLVDEGRFAPSVFTDKVWNLADSAGVLKDTEDLLARLSACHETADDFRLWPILFAHRDPFRLESMTRSMVADFTRVPADSETPPFDSAGPGMALQAVARWSQALELQRVTLTAPQTPTEFIEQIESRYQLAQNFLDDAFAKLTDDEQGFLESNLQLLLDAFETQTYIHFDDDKNRFASNKRSLELASRVDRGALIQAALAVAPLTEKTWLQQSGALFVQSWGDSASNKILLDHSSHIGRIVVAGTGDNWHKLPDPAFLLDLGGNDFHSGNAGSSAGRDRPICIHADLGGNDAWESTLDFAQGTGFMGIGALIDLRGDDSYLLPMAGQGMGLLGVGWLQDFGGNDCYRSRSFSQGIGLFGSGLLLDRDGDDHYEARVLSQAVGLAGGLGLLRDAQGNDRYFAKGLVPTAYGDSGIFDAWSQGCGMGFRSLASGGIGLLVDQAGRDRFEAGNFSQGGGYYYGMGVLAANGSDDDQYIGSRYNQGFSAHQALGVFLEAGGNDSYTTRQGVAQGLAWDECVTLFMDVSGNDTYSGGAFFSQGASAHNSFCFFIDNGGADDYNYLPGQARAGANDYHGGTSFSLFIDAGQEKNSFNWPDKPVKGFWNQPEHGFFLEIDEPLQTLKAN